MKLGNTTCATEITTKEEFDEYNNDFFKITKSKNEFDKFNDVLFGSPKQGESFINETPQYKTTYFTTRAIKTNGKSTIYSNQVPALTYVFDKNGKCVNAAWAHGSWKQIDNYFKFNVDLTPYSYVEVSYHIVCAVTNHAMNRDTLIISFDESAFSEYLMKGESYIELSSNKILSYGENKIKFTEQIGLNLFNKYEPSIIGSTNSWSGDENDITYNQSYKTTYLIPLELNVGQTTIYCNYRPHEIKVYNISKIGQAKYDGSNFSYDETTKTYSYTISAFPSSKYIQFTFSTDEKSNRYADFSKLVISLSPLTSNDYIKYDGTRMRTFDEDVITDKDLLPVYDFIKDSIPQRNQHESMFIGDFAGNSSNVIGKDAEHLDYGKYNVGVGYMAMYSNTTGDHNVAVGYRTLGDNRSGDANTAIGHEALFRNVSGGGNVAVGARTLNEHKTGQSNIAVGNSSGYYLSSGNNNTFIGSACGNSIKQGETNVMVGSNILYEYDYGTGKNISSVNASNNVMIGSNILENDNIDNLVTTNNILIGKDIKREDKTSDLSNSITIGNTKAINNQTTIGNNNINSTVIYGDLIVVGTDGIKRKIKFNDDNTCSWEVV